MQQKKTYEQRGRKIEICDAAKEAAEYIALTSLCAAMIHPDTDVVLYWAELVQKAIDLAVKEEGDGPP